LVGAVVDIWQADASGLYSNVGPNLQREATPGETFMRGHQITDAQGTVEFDTVVPGWEVIAAPPPNNFVARTTHIHVKVFHEWQVFDTQLYFPDALIDELYANAEPYRSFSVVTAPGSDQQIARIRNSEDGVYSGFDESVSQQAPMEIERVDGRLVANATIGWLGAVNRGMPPLFR
jgi:protocatechuate 3,4-dioxygenase beta subunit